MPVRRPPQTPGPADRNRRRLLRSGAGMAGLAVMPWLSGCGGDTAVAIPTPEMPLAGPRGLHLSFGADTRNERFVTWFTDGLNVDKSFVEFGTVEPGQPLDAPFPERVDGDASQAFDIDVMTHRARLRGIDPDKDLRYRVSDGTHASPVQVAKAIPRDNYRFCHFADNGLTAPAQWVQDGIMQREPHFFFLPGDLSYADGNQPEWDEWFQRMEPLAATSPMICTGGNHEQNDGNGDGWLSRVSHPFPPALLGPARGWYAYDINRIAVVASTGGAFVADLRLAEEIIFVETQLARAALRRARGEIDFIVFTNHFTIWTDQAGRGPNNFALVAIVEDMLLRYGVDLVVVGHDHVYQRSHPMAYGRRRDSGYIHVNGGCGGKSMRAFDPISEWSASAETRYGFIEYDVTGERIKATAYAVDEEDNSFAGGRLEIMDEFIVNKRDRRLVLAAVQPPRESEMLLADIRAVEAHTRLRNQLHLHNSTDVLRERLLRVSI